MSRIFISHSSRDNDSAIGLRDWLAQQGWDDVFLDTDPKRGIAAGEHWERALHEAARRCEAVLFLVSRSWLASNWCLKEFNLAYRLNKRLFGVLVEDLAISELPESLTREWQLVSLASGQDHALFQIVRPTSHEQVHVTFSREGLTRLRLGLERSGLDAKFFAWPPESDPNRAPYRGLAALEAEDAGIFFGREAATIGALDRLRGLNEAAPPRLMVILGASGAGKSSYLRAGLLPKLARDDRHFLPLPVIRPGRAAITGETGLLRALETAFERSGAPIARADIRAALGGGLAKLRALLTNLAEKARAPLLADDPAAKPPVLILPIDQGEELFLADGAQEAKLFLSLLAELIRLDAPAMTAVIAIRSDSYERLQTTKALEGVEPHLESLPPMPRTSYHAVIDGPAQRLRETSRSLVIDPALTQALLADIEAGGGSDALPLLAFTLERLYLEFGARERLTLDDYQKIGGIGGSIEAAVERALAAADADPRIPADRSARLALLRRGLIPWLAGIDPDSGSPRRRVARKSEIPVESLPLIEMLVEQRLLTVGVSDQTREVTIEPAHEALLRQWGLLDGWLKEDFGALATLEGVKLAARDWEANDKNEDWLNHSGARLEDAISLEARPDLAARFNESERNYILECRKREEQKLSEKEQEQSRRLADAESLAAANARIANRTRAGLAAALCLTALALLFGLYAMHARSLSEANARDAELQKTRAEQQSDLAKARTAESLARLQLANRRESAFLAKQSQEIGDSGDKVRAEFVALAGLPDDFSAPERPIVDASLSALGIASNFDSALGILKGHHARVYSVSYSPSGDKLLTSSIDGSVRLWDAQSGAEILNLEAKSNAKKDADADAEKIQADFAIFSPNGEIIVSAHNDKTIRLWDKNGIQIRVIHTASNATQLAFNPDGRTIAAACDNAITYEVKSGRQIAEFKGHKGGVTSVAYSPDGRKLLTGSNDNTARLWDIDSGKQLGVFEGHEDWVNSVAYSPDGRLVATGSDDGTARIWNADKFSTKYVLKGHDDKVFGVSFHPAGKSLVTTSKDKTVLTWDVENGEQISKFIGHAGFVYSASFAPSGRKFATASEDGTVRLWEASTRPVVAATIAPNAINSLAYSPTDDRVVVGTDGSEAIIWSNVSAPRSMMQLKGHSGKILAAKFDPSGSLIATASEDHTARVWNSRDGHLIATLKGHTDKVLDLDFSADGKIATASADGTAKLWDPQTGKELLTFVGHGAGVNSAAFGADGQSLLTASADKTARIWSTKSGEEKMRLIGHSEELLSAQFSSDERQIITSSPDDSVRVWDTSTGKEKYSIKGPFGNAMDVIKGEIGGNFGTPIAYGSRPKAALSPNNKRIITDGDDFNARLWDAETGQLISLLKGHSALVNSVAFSREGELAETASQDGTIKIWDANSGALLSTFNPDQGSFFHGGVQFSPDSKTVTGYTARNVIMSFDTRRLWSNILPYYNKSANFLNLAEDEKNDLGIHIKDAINKNDSSDNNTCELLAAHPFDPMNVSGKGVLMDSLNAEMAVPACRKALGEHGDDPKYSYLLARSLYQNNDNEESFRLANSACERSYAAACQLAGQLLEEGFGPNASAVAAVEKYQRAINLGALFAADSLGNLKWRGADGVAQDKAGAINLFERAAAAGFPPADEALADAYAIGDGVERNAEKAFTHYAIAATMLESKGYSSEIVDQAIARRGTIARSMDPSIVARIWRESVLPLISRK